jgi:hypothetical protein
MPSIPTTTSINAPTAIDRPIPVSIIIPAYNVAAYIGDALTSLRDQTHPHWEAIVIDDGSTDGTVEIIQAWMKRDHRIQLHQQSHQGGCAARNHGAELATHDWLLFFDADDWLATEYLATMTAALAAEGNTQLDAVRCSWSRVTADGTLIETIHANPDDDVFKICVLGCGFQVATCIIRRARFEQVGGFDITLPVAQDWDFWQRVARSGAVFGVVPAVLSYYRTLPGSVSSVGDRFLPYGLQVIARGHQADPRVTHSDRRYAAGLDPATLPTMSFYFLLWCAGLLINQGQSPQSLLANYPIAIAPDATAELIAESLRSAFLASGLPPRRWHELWPQREPLLTDFLIQVSVHCHRPELAQATLRSIEKRLLTATIDRVNRLIGRSYALNIDLTQPLTDWELAADQDYEQLYCWVSIADIEIGQLELPVRQNPITASNLSAVIAGEFFWVICGHFFQHNCDRYSQHAPQLDYDYHCTIGWETFLQELCHQPHWPNERFYQLESDLVLADMSNPDSREAHHNEAVHQFTVQYDRAIFTIEITQPFPSIQFTHVVSDTAQVIMTVGGHILGVVPVPIIEHRITASALRSTLLLAGDRELCRWAVNAGIIGQPLQNGRSLHERLQSSWRRQPEPDDRDLAAIAPLGSCWWTYHRQSEP